MSNYNNLFNVLGINRDSRKEVNQAAKLLDVTKKELLYYNDQNILPSGKVLTRIASKFQVRTEKVKIGMGIIDEKLINKFKEHLDDLENVIHSNPTNIPGFWN